MRILNIGCGAVRPKSWVNLDNLHEQLLEGTPERDNLNKEKNYINHDISLGTLPFAADMFSAVLLSHVIEHFDCRKGMEIIKEAGRVANVVVVSVPDASYFREVNDCDNVETAVELFGEPIHLPDGETTFFDYALWMRQHYAILTEDSLWAYFKKAGFRAIERFEDMITPETEAIKPYLNRTKFSLIMVGVK